MCRLRPMLQRRAWFCVGQSTGNPSISSVSEAADRRFPAPLCSGCWKPLEPTGAEQRRLCLFAPQDASMLGLSGPSQAMPELALLAGKSPYSGRLGLCKPDLSGQWPRTPLYSGTNSITIVVERFGEGRPPSSRGLPLLLSDLAVP